MSSQQATIHRHGSLHQQNKSHKSRKATKGTVNRKAGGRMVADPSEQEEQRKKNLKAASSVVNSMTKEQRRLQQRQKLNQRRQQLVHDKRIGSNHGPPKIVSIISLGQVADSHAIYTSLYHSQGGATKQGMDAEDTSSAPVAPVTFVVQEFKMRMTLFEVQRSIQSVLDAITVSDIVLLVINAEEGVDKDGELFIRLLRAQGFPSVIVLVQGVSNINNHKKQKDAKRNVDALVEKQFADKPRIVYMDEATEPKILLRWINEQKVKKIHWRENRPYVLIDKWQFTPYQQAQREQLGSLVVSGYLRGKAISANHLVHLLHYGTYQLENICADDDPYPLNSRNEKQPRQIIRQPDEKQESLQTEIIPDAATVDQLMMPPPELPTKEKKLKKVPKGFSAYQASWIVDDEAAEKAAKGSDGDDDDSMDGDGNDSEGGDDYEKISMKDDDKADDDDEEYEYIDVSETQTAVDKTFNIEEDEKMTDEERSAERERLFALRRAQEDDAAYPDEVDTPQHISARQHFNKYRGLANFKTSKWDPKESLPLDYSRIFQFENFQRSMKIAMGEVENGVQPDEYRTFTIKNVPASFVKAHQELNPLLVMFGLLKHEQKTSLVNFQIKKWESYDEAVKSKEELFIQVGYRTFKCNPIFSEHNPRNDKFKMERFLHPGSYMCASIFAPITFRPAPVIVFKKNPQSRHGVDIVASGSMYNTEPDRIILKRIIITGMPFKIHKRQSVVRYMFTNPDDVRWFKPVEVYTKHGRRGLIKEPLGTHGYMKCVFEDNITADDTICMNLYKRVFPKWTTELASLLYKNVPLRLKATPSSSAAASSASSVVIQQDNAEMSE